MTAAGSSEARSPSPGVVIRRLDVDSPYDFASLIEMCAEHADYERLRFEESGQVERWRQHLESGRLHVFFAEAHGDVVGYAAVSLEYSTWSAREYLHLDCLYIRGQARGRGLGAELLHAVKDHAQAAGCCEMQWQTPPWNEKAVGFYTRHGATNQPKLRFSMTLESEP